MGDSDPEDFSDVTSDDEIEENLETDEEELSDQIDSDVSDVEVASTSV